MKNFSKKYCDDNNYYYNNYDYNNYDYNNYDYNNYNFNNYDYIELNLKYRIFAKIIDCLISFISHYFIVIIYNYYFIPKLRTQYILIGLVVCIVINLIIQFLFIPAFIFKGQTIGKRILKIKTIKKQGFLITPKEVFIEFLFIFLFPIDIFYFIKNQEFLHNKLCNTYIKKMY